MSRITSALVAVLIALVTASVATAQSHPIFDATGLQPHRDYFSQLPFEHVDPSTGGLVLTFTDLVLPGDAGRDLVFQRTYNSKGNFGGDSGRWSFGIAGIPLWVEDTWPMTPEFNPILHTADGGGSMAATEIYSDANRRVILLTDRFWKYYRNSRTLWMPDGTVISYNNPFTVTDPFGNVVLTITSSGQTVVVTQTVLSAAGNLQTRTVEITFAANCGMAVRGCMPTSMTYAGRTWTYAAEGTFLPGYFLSEVQPPVGPPWRYEYGASGQGRTMKVITPHGGAVEYTIETLGFPWIDGETIFSDVVMSRQTTDTRGGQSSGIWTFEYDWDSHELAKSSTIVAPDGSRTKYDFSFAPGIVGNNGFPYYVGRLYLVTQRKRWQGAAEPTCDDAAECETRKYGWIPIPTPDNATLPAMTSRTIVRDGRAHTTTFDYSPSHYGDFHQPNSIVENSDGGTGLRERTTTRTFTHSANAPFSAPYIVRLPASETVEEPGAAQSQTTTSSWTYDAANGFMLSETRAGSTTTFARDDFGNIATITRPNGKSTSYSYRGGQVRQIVTAEHTTERVINDDGTIASETMGRYTTSYEHDDLGRRIRTRPPGYPAVASEIVTTYDNMGGATVTVARGASQAVTTLDGFGRGIESIADGVRTVRRYDAFGRPTFLGYPVNVADPDIGTTIEYLDPLGRETRRINPGGSFSQRAYGAATITITDEQGRSTVENWAAFGGPDDARMTAMTDADAKTWSYGYNVAGQLVGLVAHDGIMRSWVYDASFLLEREVHPESGTTMYGYTAGVLTTRTDANNVATTYTYDGNDRVKTATTGGVVTTTIYESGTDSRAWVSNGTVASTFLYDEAGRLERRQDAIDGKLFNTRFEYTADDALKAIVYPTGRRIEYQHDAAGRITSVSEPAAGRDYAFGLTYHPSGALRAYTAGNLIQTQIGFDPQRYWVRSITSGSLQLTYDDYDPVGNVRTIGDPRFGTQTFTYDAVDRLQTAVGPYGSVIYAYDAHGSRQSANGSTYEYQPGTLRLTNQNGTPFTYDSAGNTATAGGATYTYTPQNMLASAAVPGGTATYAYDPDLLRIKKSFAGSTTYFVRGLGGELLTEWKDPGSSGSARDYVYAGSRLIAAVDAANSDPNNQCGIVIVGGPAVTVSALSGQNPCLKFAGRAGQQVSASVTSVTPTSYNGTWWVGMRAPNGASLGNGTAVCCGDRVAFLDTRTLAADGDYTLEIDPYNTANGTVSVRIYDVVHVTGTIAQDGQPVTASLTTPGQNALLTFQGVAGQRISASLSAISPSSFSGVWYLKILKPDGSPLGQSFDCCVATIFRDTLLLPATGTYTLVVDPSAWAVGTVAARLWSVTHIESPIATTGDPVTVALTTPGQNGNLTFNGVSGQRVSARLIATSPATLSGFWYLRILRSDNGTQVGYSYGCCGDASIFRDTLTLPVTGTYTLVVDPDKMATGTVSVRLWDVVDVVGTLTVGGDAVPVNLPTPGQKATYTFSGTAGQQATVRMTSNTMGSVTVTLRRPDNSTTSTTSSSASFNLATQTLQSGTYTVTVDPVSANTGTMTLTVTTP